MVGGGTPPELAGEAGRATAGVFEAASSAKLLRICVKVWQGDGGMA